MRSDGDVEVSFPRQPPSSSASAAQSHKVNRAAACLETPFVLFKTSERLSITASIN